MYVFAQLKNRYQRFIEKVYWGQGKSTYMFSTQRRQISAFHLLTLTTEAWRGAEIRRRSAENVYVDLPGPGLLKLSLEAIYHDHKSQKDLF